MPQETDPEALSPDERADFAIQLDARLQADPEQLPFDLLPGRDQPERRSAVAALMLEIASAVRGFDPTWLKVQIGNPDLVLSRRDQQRLLRNLFCGRVEERRPVLWSEFSGFGFSSAELNLRADIDRASLGQDFDRELHLEARIASGGVAVVYRGRQRSDDRPVAVKVPKQVADDPDDETAQRLLDEAGLLRRLTVAGVPQLLELRREPFGPMLVLEWVDTDGGHGIPGSAPLRDRLRWIADLARTLDRVHQLDLIHGDVKMENILIDRQGTAWLTDFNITRQADPRLNRDGSLPGTLDMMSQEALVGVAADADISQDIYALGAVLYQTLTGRRLVNQPSREAALVASVLLGGVHAPEYPAGTADELKQIVQTATSRHIHLRFTTAGDLAATVERFLDGTLTAAEIPPVRRGLQAWQAGTRLGLCLIRSRKFWAIQEFDATAGIAPDQLRRIRHEIGQGATAALAAEELGHNFSVLHWPLPPCPCLEELMTLFYRHARLTESEFPSIRALAEQLEAWLRTVCQELEATVGRQDPRNYLLLVTAMQARLSFGSATARSKWPEIAAAAGLPETVAAAFRETLVQNPAEEATWATALQGLDFSVVKWLRWGSGVTPAESTGTPGSEAAGLS